MDNGKKPPRATRHGLVQYALTEQPRPGDRETRMRETCGAWLQRNEIDRESEGMT